MGDKDDTTMTDDLTAGGLSKLSGSLDAAGEVARRTGTLVRDGLHDSARAVARGGAAVRRSGVVGATVNAGRKLGRKGAATLGVAAAVGAGAAALLIRRRGHEGSKGT